VPHGGQFDATTGASAPLTERPPFSGGGGPGAILGFDDTWVVAYGQAYRPGDGTWLALDEPAAIGAYLSGATWVDGRLFVWGGATEHPDGSTTFSASGAIWTPPDR